MAAFASGGTVARVSESLPSGVWLSVPARVAESLPSVGLSAPAPLVERLSSVWLSAPAPVVERLSSVWLSAPAPVAERLSSAWLSAPAPVAETPSSVWLSAPAPVAESLPSVWLSAPAPVAESLPPVWLPAPVSESPLIAWLSATEPKELLAASEYLERENAKPPDGAASAENAQWAVLQEDDDYDPRSPEFVQQATSTEVMVARLRLLGQQIVQLKATIALRERVDEKDSCEEVLKHYRQVLADLLEEGVQLRRATGSASSSQEAEEEEGRVGEAQACAKVEEGVTKEKPTKGILPAEEAAALAEAEVAPGARTAAICDGQAMTAGVEQEVVQAMARLAGELASKVVERHGKDEDQAMNPQEPATADPESPRVVTPARRKESLREQRKRRGSFALVERVSAAAGGHRRKVRRSVVFPTPAHISAEAVVQTPRKLPAPCRDVVAMQGPFEGSATKAPRASSLLLHRDITGLRRGSRCREGAGHGRGRRVGPSWQKVEGRGRIRVIRWVHAKHGCRTTPRKSCFSRDEERQQSPEGV